MRTLATVGSLAERFGVKSHAIEYIIKSRHIAPVARAGSAYVFDEAAERRIGEEIAQMRTRRVGIGASVESDNDEDGDDN